MTQELKLEVGKKYRNRRGEIETITDFKRDSTHPFRGESRRFYKENGRWLITVDHNWDLIEEIKEEKTMKIKDAKLVKGKKYNIKWNSYNPYTFVGTKEEYGFEEKKNNFIFIDKEGDCSQWEEEIEIEEYREPINKTSIGYIPIVKYEEPEDDCILDQLTGMYCLGSELYSSKEEALETAPIVSVKKDNIQIKRFKITVEELTDE